MRKHNLLKIALASSKNRLPPCHISPFAGNGSTFLCVNRAPSASIARSSTRGTGEVTGGPRGELGVAAFELLEGDADQVLSAGEFPVGGLYFLYISISATSIAGLYSGKKRTSH